MWYVVAVVCSLGVVCYEFCVHVFCGCSVCVVGACGCCVCVWPGDRGMPPSVSACPGEQRSRFHESGSGWAVR